MKYSIQRIFLRLTQCLIYRLCCVFPIKNKVVATAVVGRRFADNPKFIYEELLKKHLNAALIWVKDPKWEVSVPNGIKLVSSIFSTMYSYATAKVVISTTNYPFAFRKRNGQCVINTWHGGLGIKKLERGGKRDEMMCDMTDVFISNSDHLSKIYRETFGYKGPIWKCGYPKNDMLVGDMGKVRQQIRHQLNIPIDSKVMIYAPTYRDYPTDYNPYDIDFNSLLSTLKNRDNHEWFILLKYHPNLQKSDHYEKSDNDHVKDVTFYHDMQELIAASDALISDYSSCIFDAAIAGLECYIYANDFQKYKQGRGTYFELSDLPFPVATNNKELIREINNYYSVEWHGKWKSFSDQQGLVETGHAAKDIAKKIEEYLEYSNVEWENTDI